MTIGPIELISGDEYFRPTLWISLPRLCLMVAIGWPVKWTWVR